MNKIILIFLIIISPIEIFSQKKVLIKGKEEIVYPFDISQPDLFFNWTKDKINFDSIVIFSMGEATHGTKEFFEIKTKSFIYLVTHENFKIFGIEASYGECNYINDFLQTGVGNIDSVMRYFSFWTWRTEEVKELINWIKEYNRNSEGKIIFYGFDMQDCLSPLKYNATFFNNDTSIFVKEYLNITNSVLSKKKYLLRKLLKDNKEFKDTLIAVREELYLWLEEYKYVLATEYSLYQTKRIKLSIDNFNQAINIYNSSIQYRDSCMALNILEIQKIEIQKMFIWAHNGHVNKARSPQYHKSFGKPMGWFLSKKLHDAYYSIGFVFRKGSFQACVYNGNDLNNKRKYKLTEVDLPINKRNSFTEQLAKVNEESFFIDITNSKNNFFTKNLKTYDIGAVFFGIKHKSQKIIPKNQFDGIIYLEKTNASIRME